MQHSCHFKLTCYIIPPLPPPHHLAQVTSTQHALRRSRQTTRYLAREHDI